MEKTSHFKLPLDRFLPEQILKQFSQKMREEPTEHATHNLVHPFHELEDHTANSPTSHSSGANSRSGSNSSLQLPKAATPANGLSQRELLAIYQLIAALCLHFNLKERGHTCYFAGGCVRDAWMKHPSHDIDLASSATPQEAIALAQTLSNQALLSYAPEEVSFPVKVIPLGQRFGSVCVVFKLDYFTSEILDQLQEAFPQLERFPLRACVEQLRSNHQKNSNHPSLELNNSTKPGLTKPGLTKPGSTKPGSTKPDRTPEASRGALKCPRSHHIQIELTSFRSDGFYSDGRRPDKITPAQACEDAQRRDFTINGLFYDPLQELVIDFVGGTADIESGLIRAIGDPYKRFREDRLRILRALRFQGRLQFNLESSTHAAMIELSGDLSEVLCAERIGQEWSKMHRDETLEKLLEESIRDGILRSILPIHDGPTLFNNSYEKIDLSELFIRLKRHRLDAFKLIALISYLLTAPPRRLRAPLPRDDDSGKRSLEYNTLFEPFARRWKQSKAFVGECREIDLLLKNLSQYSEHLSKHLSKHLLSIKPEDTQEIRQAQNPHVRVDIAGKSDCAEAASDTSSIKHQAQVLSNEKLPKLSPFMFHSTLLRAYSNSSFQRWVIALLEIEATLDPNFPLNPALWTQWLCNYAMLLQREANKQPLIRAADVIALILSSSETHQPFDAKSSPLQASGPDLTSGPLIGKLLKRALALQYSIEGLTDHGDVDPRKSLPKVETSSNQNCPSPTAITTSQNRPSDRTDASDTSRSPLKPNSRPGLEVKQSDLDDHTQVCPQQKLKQRVLDQLSTMLF